MSQHKDIIQFNCRGVRGQYHQIKQLIVEFTPKFILLQELQIKKASDVKFKGYTLILKLVGSWKSPSVGILIADGIIFDLIDTPDSICVIGINTFCNGPVSLFSFYDNEKINQLNEANLNIIYKAGINKPIIMGDFNARNSLWDSNRKKNPFSDSRSKSIINFINNSNCTILNDGAATRISPILNQMNSALDLTIVDTSLYSLFEWSVAECSYGSDHLPTMLVSNRIFESSIKKIWDYVNTDWDLFNINCNISHIFENDENDIDILQQRLHHQILNGLEKSTPLLQFKPGKRKKPPWWDTELTEMKKEKTKLLKKFVKLHSKVNMIALKKANAKYQKAISEKKKISWEKFVSETGDLESKDLWKRIGLINGKSVNKIIKNIEDDQGIVVEDQEQITNILGQFYQSISSMETLSEVEKNNLLNQRNELRPDFINKFPELCVDFNMNELMTAISNTKNSSPGKDGYKYIIYKKLRLKNITALLKFYNKIWESGKRPTAWNVSKVIPIPKSTNIKKAKDTRPINLFNTDGKLYDKMINSRLSYILEFYNLLDKQQFGFRKNKQTLSSMLILNKDVLNAFKKSSHIQLISFDIFKAFDRIWPETILEKLQNYGIGGRIYNYIYSFLGKREFTVSNGMSTSSTFVTELGVPQGSPLSSTLFLVAFQGILDEIKNMEGIKYSAYADDLVIYSCEEENEDNTKILQDAIKKITDKGMKTGLKFSVEKSNAIHFCNKRNCERTPNRLYNKVIQEVDSIRILGIIWNKKLNFTNHINMLKLKLTKDLQLIKIISNSRYGLNHDLIKNIVQAISISKIKYGIEIYSKTSGANLKIINTMINHFNRRITLGFVTSPVVSLNIVSGIPSMEQIMEQANLHTAARMRANSDIDYPIQRTNNHHYNIHLSYNITSAEDNSTLLEVLRNVSIISPLKCFKQQIFPNIFGTNKDNMSSVDARKIFRDFIERNNFDKIVYTDGSKKVDSSTYAVTTNSSVLFMKKLHNRTSIFSAEALGILKAVIYLNSSATQSSNVIISDSQSVIAALFNKSKKENELIKQIMLSLSEKTFIVWVPSHFDIPGNEMADQAASDAHLLDEEVDNIVSQQDLQAHMKSFLLKKFQSKWTETDDNKLRVIQPMIKYVKFNGILTRKEEMVINRLKIGHTYLTHQFKLSKENRPICEWCDNELTVQHIFSCVSDYVESLKIKYLITSFQEMIFDESMYKNIFDFLKELKYFHLI